MALQTNSRQIPDHAIVDYYNKQAYLGNQFIYATQITVGTSETLQILLSNPITNAQTVTNAVKPSTIFIRKIKLVTETNAQAAWVNVYGNPTVTGAGTTQTPSNIRLASLNTSIANLTTVPTASSNGTLLYGLGSTNVFSDESFFNSPCSAI